MTVLSISAIEAACGVFTFAASSGPDDYLVYYLTHHSSGGGAVLHFHWDGCDSHNRTCVTTVNPFSHPVAATPCASVDVGSALVVSLENRPNPAYIYDYTASGEPFNGFTAMELIPVPQETASFVSQIQPKELMVFVENRQNHIRNFADPPAKWMRNSGPVTSFSTCSISLFLHIYLCIYIYILK